MIGALICCALFSIIIGFVVRQIVVDHRARENEFDRTLEHLRAMQEHAS